MMMFKVNVPTPGASKVLSSSLSELLFEAIMGPYNVK